MMYRKTCFTCVLVIASFGILDPGTARGAEQGFRVLFTFDSPDAGRAWQTVNDGVMGGRSDGRVKMTDNKIMQFFGTLSLEDSGGFASVRSRPGKLNLSEGDTLVARVRGDGRSYFWNLYVPGRRMAFSYRAPFETKDGQWTEVSTPLKDFYATSFGRRIPNAPLNPSEVNSIGFLLADKQAGPFRLEVEWIKVTPNDTRVVRTESDYYTTGPQQGRPADGKFPDGTKVMILEQAGSYVRVRSEDGVEAFVSGDALEELGTSNKVAHMDVSQIVTGGNRFAVDLYQQLRREHSGNFFFSPASISVAFAMTSAGAKGETASEMTTTLHLPASDTKIHDRLKHLQSTWTKHEEGVRLDVANRLWAQQGEEFLGEFLDVTRDKYGAELARVDFVRQTEESRKTINTWVADQTEQKITDLIPAGVLSRDTVLVLTNAVYFHGLWSSPFDKRATKEDDFHVSADQTVSVPFMHQQKRLRYALVDRVQVLELPYGKGNFSMVVLLPEEMDGLARLEERLTAVNLKAWSDRLWVTEVIVYLPRFKTSSAFTLNETLQSLGMVSAFDGSRADFSGMNGKRNLFISAALHKAYVDVNEEGTEAAAATGIVIGRTSLPAQPERPPVFRADHPFVFMIRDTRTGAILFLGRMQNPA